MQGYENDSGVVTKARIDMKIDPDLKFWVQDYARRMGTTVTDLIKNYFIHLRTKEQEMERMDSVRQI